MYVFIYFILFMCIYNESLGEEQPERDNESNYENNNCKCNTHFSTAVITINKYDQISNLHENYKPFSSACMQCLLCTTIAQELHKSLVSLHANYPPTDMADTALVSRTMQKLCENGFNNFDLREYKDVRFLSENTLETDHVPSMLDNLWKIQLKHMCHKYLNAAGEVLLYERWFEEAQHLHFDVTNFLCRYQHSDNIEFTRSYGLYQHCRNIPIMSEKVPKSTTKTCFDRDQCLLQAN